ncbi:hypothetical protein [Marinimicrobium sp. C2-29]|uniref:hypothetical protein n=1 Tax=Marinimicrobium sp. C2-29 TaxID=3139825 RepID=UPI003138FC67
MLKRLTGVACGLLLSLLTSIAAAEVVVVVSADNALDSLSRAQLSDLYLGRSVSLPNGESLTPIDQSDRSPAHEQFYQEYLGRSPAQIKSHWSRLIFTGRGQPPRSVSDSQAVADVVSDDRTAIGYIDSNQVPVDNTLRVLDIE